MSINAKDGTGQNISIAAEGLGTVSSPFTPRHVNVSPTGQYVAPVTQTDLAALVPAGITLTAKGIKVDTGLAFLGLATGADVSEVVTALSQPLRLNTATPLNITGAVSATVDTSSLATATGQETLATAIAAVITALAGPLTLDTTTPLNVAGALSADIDKTGLASVAGQATAAQLLTDLKTILSGIISVDTGLSLGSLATQTTLAAVLTKLNAGVTVSTGLSDLATQTTAAALLAKLNGTVTVSTGLTGLATQTTLAAADTKLGLIAKDSTVAKEATLATRATESTLATRATETTLAAVSTKLSAELAVNRVKGLPAQGLVTIAAAGTAQQIPAKVLKNYVLLQWVPANTGPIYFGSVTTGNNYTAPFLDASNPRVVLEVANASDIWVNADTAADKVVYYAT